MNRDVRQSALRTCELFRNAPLSRILFLYGRAGKRYSAHPRRKRLVRIAQAQVTQKHQGYICHISAVRRYPNKRAV